MKTMHNVYICLQGICKETFFHLHPIPIQQDVHGRKSSEVR